MRGLKKSGRTRRVGVDGDDESRNNKRECIRGWYGFPFSAGGGEKTTCAFPGNGICSDISNT